MPLSRMHRPLGFTACALFLSLLFPASQQSPMLKNCLQTGDKGKVKDAYGPGIKLYKPTPGSARWKAAGDAHPARQTSGLRSASSTPRVGVQPSNSLPREKRPRIKQENLPRGWMAWDMRPFFKKISSRVRSMMSKLKLSIKSTLARLRSLVRKAKPAAPPAENSSAGVTSSKVSEDLSGLDSNMPNSAVGSPEASSVLDHNPADNSLWSQGNPEKPRTSDSSKPENVKSAVSAEDENSGGRRKPTTNLADFEAAKTVDRAQKNDLGDTSSKILVNQPEPLGSSSHLPAVAVKGDKTGPLPAGQEQQGIPASKLKDGLGGHPTLRVRVPMQRFQEQKIWPSKNHENQDRW